MNMRIKTLIILAFLGLAAVPAGALDTLKTAASLGALIANHAPVGEGRPAGCRRATA